VQGEATATPGVSHTFWFAPQRPLIAITPRAGVSMRERANAGAVAPARRFHQTPHMTHDGAAAADRIDA
jgi:hypothetical protein